MEFGFTLKPDISLERASFIDTPANEQARIAGFCARVLDLLPLPEGPGSRPGGRDAAREA